MFKAMCSLPSKYVRTKYRQLHMIRDYICGDANQKCSVCYNVFHKVKDHCRVCPIIKFNTRRYITLTLNGRVHMCQFGCTAKTTSMG